MNDFKHVTGSEVDNDDVDAEACDVDEGKPPLDGASVESVYSCVVAEEQDEDRAASGQDDVGCVEGLQIAVRLLDGSIDKRKVNLYFLVLIFEVEQFFRADALEGDGYCTVDLLLQQGFVLLEDWGLRELERQ